MAQMAIERKSLNEVGVLRERPRVDVRARARNRLWFTASVAPYAHRSTGSGILSSASLARRTSACSNTGTRRAEPFPHTGRTAQLSKRCRMVPSQSQRPSYLM